MTKVTDVRWRKSTRSNQDTNCVEIAHTLDLVRDSKNPAGDPLEGDVMAFVTAVRGGRFDR